jgi:alpha-amylase
LHWQKLGNFRKNHPAIGAGIHQEISASPYVFSRAFTKDNFTDKVVIGLNLPKGEKEISVGVIFKDGTKLHDAYSGKKAVVSDGKVRIDSEFDIVLLEK